MPPATIEITKPSILVVEGEDEKNLFNALTTHFGLDEAVQVLPIGGKTQLRTKLEALMNTPGFGSVKSFGIFRDADQDASSAFQNVCDILEEIGLPRPNELLVPTHGQPRIGVMILPGSGRSGMLEDVVLEAVQDDPEIPCVDRFLECLRQPAITFPANVSKARIQVYLAAKGSDYRLGVSASRGYWSYDHSAFAEVIGFIRNIAQIE